MKQIGGLTRVARLMSPHPSSEFPSPNPLSFHVFIFSNPDRDGSRDIAGSTGDEGEI